MTVIINGTDSSATTPALTGGTAGTSTGPYFPATNQWAVSTNGTQAMLVDASQNVTFAGTLTSTGYASLPNTFGFKNRIINGAMVIDQRNAGASVTPTNAQYTLDRWQGLLAQASKYTVIQSSTAPTGFINSLLVTSSSAYSVGASDYFDITQYIEGLNMTDLAWGTASAATVTLSFWVRSSLTGTFGGSLQNNGQARSYPFSYTISNANTFEYKTITIAGDTSGTWLTTNGRGIQLNFSLGTGSTFSGTAGAWATANYLGTTGATSVVGTNAATFYITGVQLEKGSTATSFDYLDYGRSLIQCQRYYEKSFPATWVPGTASFATGFIATTSSSASGGEASGARFIVPKRASPTVVTYNAVTGASASAYRVSDGVNVSSTPTHVNEGAIGYIAVPINSNGYYWHFTASAEL